MEAAALKDFLEQFQDHLAPRLDTYEQAIYLYIFRHSRLLGLEEVVIGLKSERKRLAFGIGLDGSPMSESTAYKKLASLEAKGAIKILGTEHKGRRLRLQTPKEMGILPEAPTSIPQRDLEHLDFFNDPVNRLAILQREGGRCFYTRKKITPENFIVEHVVSRPHGNNGYRNVVAACREANNRKGNLSAGNFLRSLFRDGFLSDAEFQDRVAALDDLAEGRLKPRLE